MRFLGRKQVLAYQVCLVTDQELSDWMGAAFAVSLFLPCACILTMISASQPLDKKVLDLPGES